MPSPHKYSTYFIYARTICTTLIRRQLPVTRRLQRVVIGLLLVISGYSSANSIDLPSIGDTSSSIISNAQERRLGQAWLRLYRQQIPSFSDPLVSDYIEQLLIRLARYSDLSNQNLSLIVVNNPTLNAFAVPGGVIGVHTGLLTYAETEHQLASVLTHELAHLSQRHYARSLEQQRNSTIPNMAALLASLVLIATTSGDAGIAALSATQAASIDQQLRYSRLFEQEADRLGMENLVNAGMDPHAAAAMFEQIQRASRFSNRPPEFLLTHPLTERRIADVKNRTLHYPRKQYKDNINYQFMRTRILFQQEPSPGQAIKRFQSEVSGHSISIDASQYGLALALIADKQFAKAQSLVSALQKKYPDNTALIIAASDIALGEKRWQEAFALIEKQRQRLPNNYPLNIQLSHLYDEQGKFTQAANVLTQLSIKRPQDPYVWYLLAETEGLAGNILGVHNARAEYFILNGRFERAKTQLNNALKLTAPGSFRYTQIVEKLIEVDTIRENSKI